MATTAEILAVRKEARLHGYEYFNNINGKKLELVLQQTPLKIIAVEKNQVEMTDSAGYSFDGFRTITLTTAPADSDVYRIEVGFTATDTDIEDVYDFSKEEIYSDLRLTYNAADLASSTFVADLTEKLAAGYLIMKYWEGSSRGEDFWKMGRNWVDLAHKRCDEIKSGDRQLVNASAVRITKDVSPFQYKIIDHGLGLMPSGLYTQKAEDNDEEVY